MLTTKETEKRKQVKFICIEDLVPYDHLLRKVEKLVDFSFIREEVKDLYSEDNGRPSIDPVVLFKLVFLNYLYGLNSMRRTLRESEVNNAYRYFLGYDLLEPLPHFTTFGKNYERRFKGTDIFEKIFSHILELAFSNNLVDTTEIFIDGTHIKANANTKRNYKEQTAKLAKHYNKQLLEEINADRAESDKKPFDDDGNGGETTTVTKSTTDPESGLFHKGEHKKCFAYNVQTACNKHNFILDVHIDSGNVHDSVAFDGLYQKLKENEKLNIKAIAMDSGYRTPYIAKTLLDDGIIPVMPYHAPMSKSGFFKKKQYTYDPYHDVYTCPNEKELQYTTTNRDGYREYKSDCRDCKNCPQLTKCTFSKNTTKVIARHIWAEAIEEVERIRYIPYAKELYAKRRETIERVFADAKEKHGLRFARQIGKAKVKAQVLMTFACMNVKKILKMLGDNLDKVCNFALQILKSLFKSKTSKILFV